MKLHIAACLLVFISLDLFGADKHPEAVIDLGWVRVVQRDRGWLATEAPAVPPPNLYKGGTRRLMVGDMLLSIDGHELSTYGPLGVAQMLDEVPTRRVPITLEREGQPHRVLALGEGVLTGGKVYSEPRYQRAELQKRSEPAPAFELPDVHGRSHQLAEFKGKWLLIVFWGTWCSGCMDEIPDLNALTAEQKDKLSVVGIDLKDSLEKLNKFLAENQIHYVVLRGGDFDGPIARRYNFRAAPWNILVSPQREVMFVAGATMNLKQEVESFITDHHHVPRTEKRATASK